MWEEMIRGLVVWSKTPQVLKEPSGMFLIGSKDKGIYKARCKLKGWELLSVAFENYLISVLILLYIFNFVIFNLNITTERSQEEYLVNKDVKSWCFIIRTKLNAYDCTKSNFFSSQLMWCLALQAATLRVFRNLWRPHHIIWGIHHVANWKYLPAFAFVQGCGLSWMHFGPII